jgi:transposase
MQLKIACPRIWLASKSVDFRFGVDGLCQIVQSQFQLDIKEGLFIFYNQSKTKIKILTWHKNGFVLIYKRIEQGRFCIRTNEKGLLSIDEKQLSWLLAGLDWASMSDWKELEFDNYF